MNKHTAESMVVSLVQCPCNVFAYAQKVPQVAGAPCKDFAGPRPWGSVLKELLEKCSGFSKDNNAVTARWRETNHRKVLAPLGENSDNIIANLDMSRKRKADSPLGWIPNKVPKLDNIKPCTVNVARSPLQRLQLEYKYCNNKPFVKLFDITKEIPQVKEEEESYTQEQFMGALGLGEPVRECRHKLKVNHSTKLLNYPGIPFSSDYGRLLLLRERHCLQDDVALRKIERVERYMQNEAEVSRKPQNFEVTFSKQTKCLHTYKFPKRQFSQKHKSLNEAFVKYLCKPVCIHLERLDLNSLIVQKTKEEVPQPNTSVLVEGACNKNCVSVNCVVKLEPINNQKEEKKVTQQNTAVNKQVILKVKKKVAVRSSATLSRSDKE